MNLNKDNMKKILGVITFTLLLTAILMNMGAVKSYFGFLWGILFPFVMGGAIAFILNLPMTAIEFHNILLAAKGVLRPGLYLGQEGRYAYADTVKSLPQLRDYYPYHNRQDSNYE